MSATTINPHEAAHFGALAADWWDPHGSSAMLHKLNQVRLSYIRDRIDAHWLTDSRDLKPLAGKRALDVGCGAGLLAEPLARMGAAVTGVDAAPENIAAARAHAAGQGLGLDYHAGELAALPPATFDLVTSMEVVEHVSDMNLVLAKCSQLVRPGGIMVVATINRTLKALGLAIFGAEYVLRWLPRGTHQFNKLVRPAELEAALDAAGMRVVDRTGVVYNPLSDRWSAARDMDVNYMLAASRPV